MKASANSRSGSAADRISRKRKRVLAVLAGVTLLTWSRTLFGGEEQPKAVVPAPSSALTTASAAKISVSHSAAKVIQNFEQAMERMRSWPLALERRRLEGQVADLSPAYWTATPASSDATAEPELQLAAEPPGDSQSGLAQPSAPLKLENEIPAVLPIQLRSTALFGSTRYAVLGNTRFQEGDSIVLPGHGTFLLESVQTRAVVLRQGERVWTLTMHTALEPQAL